MKDVIDTDLCIIGAGLGGLSVAAGAAQMGASMVLIEKGKMGGDWRDRDGGVSYFARSRRANTMKCVTSSTGTTNVGTYQAAPIFYCAPQLPRGHRRSRRSLRAPDGRF